MRKIVIAAVICILGWGLCRAEELPKPALDNALLISIELPVTNSAEVDYIKNNFNFGLYAWLCFSKTAMSVDLDWHAPWSQASQGIQGFKDTIDSYIQAASQKEVRLHVVIVAGLARYVSIYKQAKQEDIRNCQWYNDNKLASDSQIAEPDLMDTYVFGTLSRYARKMRRNLEAKSQAALSFLKQRMDENPDILTAVSGWGESELNYHRIDHSQSLQDFFCDFSPFAVLEFRDWIQHAGMYDDVNGKYAGQGYSEGGDKYWGASGLEKFNQDFDTSFTTWDLKYFHWSLNDDYDTNPTDDVNSDPHRIPFYQYTHGQMMPDSGPHYIAGGFDPPREMAADDDFWDLWNLFRELMVHHFVLDMAKWASDAEIPAQRWYSHQIPADYLFGTSPDSEDQNARYYSSASPLWTADVEPYGSVGATIYDIKFPDQFARTTDHALEAVSDLAGRWAVLEYDAETYPPGMDVSQSSVNDILLQYFNVYKWRPYLINFFRWLDNGEHRIKGMNKEKALKKFLNRVRDWPLKMDAVIEGKLPLGPYDPPRVNGLTGEQDQGAGMNQLEFSENIWADQKWKWSDWGDFSHFEVYRGETSDFPDDEEHLIGETHQTHYTDKNITQGKVYYYRIKAVNSDDISGPASVTLRLPHSVVNTLIVNAQTGGSTDPSPGVYGMDQGIEVEVTAFPDLEYVFNGWSGDASGDQNPLSLIMNADKNITALFLEDIPEPPLNFTGQKEEEGSSTQKEYLNHLTWSSNPVNTDVESYRIYEQIDGKEEMLDEVSADTSEYLRWGVDQDKLYIYSLSAVNSRGVEGDRAVTTVW
ncbi:MAG: hypothetical protein GF421_07725 [Candidatus Aminicenantes bacterium]|nr:hypothetical protein [Candidatus Aminicenantes bacterium]